LRLFKKLVHKKYSFKDGKRYGPYLYENKRVGEKVVTNYIGKGDGRRNFNWVSMVILLGLILVVSVVVFYSINLSSTGRVSANLENVIYHPGENLAGVIKLNVRKTFQK
jgi:hypothetical protein